MTRAPDGTGTDPNRPTPWIFPPAITTVWSSAGGLPVPSTTRTCVSATTGSATTTNESRTAERGWAGAWAHPLAMHTSTPTSVSVNCFIGTPCAVSLPDPHLSFCRRGQLHRVKPDTVLENQRHVLDIGGAGGKVSLNDRQIGGLAGAHRSHSIGDAQHSGAVRGHHLYRLRDREPRLDQQLELPLVTAPRGDTPDGIHPAGEQATRLHERHLVLHGLLEHRGPVCRHLAGRYGLVAGGVGGLDLRSERLEHVRVSGRPAGHGALVDGERGRHAHVVRH